MCNSGVFLQFQIDVVSINTHNAKKIVKFYNAVKHLSNDGIALKHSYEEHGLVTGKQYRISKLEIFIYHLDVCKENLSKMMNYYA